MRYWLGVVSKEHVQKAVQGGFAQVCHGKCTPLAKMLKGDLFIYYSPKMALGSSLPCKSFTAIGTIKNGSSYQVSMTPTFHPFRIDVEFLAYHDIPISNLMEQLELTQDRGWGMKLRRGLIELSQHDAELITKEMTTRSKKAQIFLTNNKNLP